MYIFINKTFNGKNFFIYYEIPLTVWQQDLTVAHNTCK